MSAFYTWVIPCLGQGSGLLFYPLFDVRLAGDNSLEFGEGVENMRVTGITERGEVLPGKNGMENGVNG